MHQLETPPDDARTAEHAAHLLRRGIGRDVEILRGALQQQIAHRPPPHIGLKARRPQAVGDFLRAVADLPARYTMQFIRYHLRISSRPGSGSLAKYAFEEFFDHAVFTELSAAQPRKQHGLYSPKVKRALRRALGRLYAGNIISSLYTVPVSRKRGPSFSHFRAPYALAQGNRGLPLLLLSPLSVEDAKLFR